MKVIDASGMHYKDLNAMIKQLIKGNAAEILVKNVQGQRYIGDGIHGNSKIIIEGTPGNDMAAYMDGATIVVHGNAQDGVANTMNDGKVVIHGNTGDILGYAMRGGEVYIKGDVGYRVGIHMKEYLDKKPVIVIGGKAGAFLGEYMAGGIIILLGLNVDDTQKIVGNYCGTGMHGGVIYSRIPIDSYKLGKEVKQAQAEDGDMEIISSYVKKFSEYFGFDYRSIMDSQFVKIYPYNHRPYGNLYAY
jgi:glutamate synthase domain-containing protein 3